MSPLSAAKITFLRFTTTQCYFEISKSKFGAIIKSKFIFIFPEKVLPKISFFFI